MSGLTVKAQIRRHRRITSSYGNNGIPKTAKRFGITESAVSDHYGGRCSCPRPTGHASPPCLYGCPLTLAGHEEAPPRAGTYHERVWKRQVRAEVKHVDGQGGRWHDCAVGRIWVPE